MSLTRALSNANSGLATTSLRADVAANNISNASTPGYVRREVVSQERVTDGSGNGVRVSNVQRAQDFALSRLRRDADSAAGRTEVVANAYQTLNTEIGLPGSGYGLFASIENLEASFKTLQATPESAAYQSAVVSAANETTQQFNALSHMSLSMRETADANIARNVQVVNDALKRIQSLNGEISGLDEVSGNTAALEDERQGLIDTIANIVPVKDIRRDNSQVDIITESGVYLLSGTVRELSFTRTPVMTDDMRYGDGTSPLSGLFVGDQDITPGSSGRHALQTGSLAGEFAIRDQIATDFTDSLDSLAADLVSRFSNDSLDPTKTPGAQGLFTDSALLVDPTAIAGSASRLSINNLVNPNVGGEVFRIRDGLGAVTPGNSGNTEIISNLLNAMTTSQTAPANSGLQGEYSVIGAAAGLTSLIGEQSLRFDSINASTIARRDILNDAEIQTSAVDTDAELQTLLVIEQAYAANARVIQTVGDMIDRLLSI